MGPFSTRRAVNRYDLYNKWNQQVCLFGRKTRHFENEALHSTCCRQPRSQSPCAHEDQRGNLSRKNTYCLHEANVLLWLGLKAFQWRSYHRHPETADACTTLPQRWKLLHTPCIKTTGPANTLVSNRLWMLAKPVMFRWLCSPLGTKYIACAMLIKQTSNLLKAALRFKTGNNQDWYTLKYGNCRSSKRYTVKYGGYYLCRKKISSGSMYVCGECKWTDEENHLQNQLKEIIMSSELRRC